MRILLLVSIATCWTLSWSQTTPQAPQLDAAAKNCLMQSNLPVQYLTDFINGKIKAEAVSPNFKCFVRCHMETRGYIKDGQILEANVVKDAENITSVAQMRKIVADCKIAKGKDICETSYNIFLCITKELS